ncbi:zinc/manganese transport system substrate-binding protein [Microbacterium trichothecenolyticum]|uniref:metal ABC transporter solute-binding protein, Zn/Mn family n=1 Tax=Microbacterium trichothecenolyticum TaxID=69370 RepID=UPI00285DE2B7|nr:zinc ABC transporter substrate-binding protein [Microbacterium trichothecenolyticum]MDR7184084.1 zinc/manganese transport system substrate-binding protein [Microbacterium trichothecenolyticum]
MTSLRRSLPVLGLAAASVFVLSGCAGNAAGDDTGEGKIAVVASTNVYGQIAEEIGGDLVDVTSIVTNESQDPHSFEPSARDQLVISKADLVIENGGGYDAFIDALIESSGTEAPVVTAVEYSHDWPENAGHDEENSDDAEDHAHDHGDHEHVEGFNEHVWYDPHTIAHVAEAIAHELGELSPQNAETFTANAEAFSADVEGLEASLDEISAAHAGEKVFVTEPVPVYLVQAAGLENATPEKFSEAVEEGQDVAPATLLESLALVKGGDVRVVITNTQTGGAETQEIVDEADGLGIPVIAFSETLPEGETYISWMQANIEALNGALQA